MATIIEPTSDIDEAELSRQSQRLAIKRTIAALQVRDAKTRTLRGQIAAVNSATDDAADEHRRRCEPYQSELDNIEQRHIDALTKKQEQDAGDAKRQRELLGLINEANAELELTAEANKRTIAGINKQIKNLQPPPGTEHDVVSTLEAKLTRLSNEEDLIRLDSLNEWATITGKLTRSIGKQMAEWEQVEKAELARGRGTETLTTSGVVRSGAVNYEAVAVYRQRVGRLRQTLAMAGAVHAEARKEVDSFRQQLIDAD